MKKTYLSMASALLMFSAIGQSVQNQNTKKLIAKELNGSYEMLKKKNTNTNRSTNISRWVSFDDAYGIIQGGTVGLVSMSNGPFSNGTDVHMLTTSGVDTIFTYGSYSLIDLGGDFYSQTHFNPGLSPFDVATDLTIDSVFAVFTYEKFDMATIDTAVVRVAVPSANQMGSSYSYLAPNNTVQSGDTARWIGVDFDFATKKIADYVVEYKVPLTPTYLADQNNWVSGDSTWISINLAASDLINGHNGLLAIEVTVAHGKQLTSADTVGVNANWFSPTWVRLDAAAAPVYSKNDWTCGGVLYTNSYFNTAGGVFSSHWFGNSANQIATSGAINPFQSPWVSLKISQTNTLTASISELENGAKLFQNYPNPTNGLTTIKYSLENAAKVSFEIVDVTGKTVFTSLEGNKTEGTHAIELNNNNLNAGVYFYSITVNGNKLTKKMTINK